MFLIASKMILCLILAAILGGIIGYLLCKLCKKGKDGKETSCCATDTKSKETTYVKDDSTTNTAAVGLASAAVLGAKPKFFTKDEVTPDDLKRISGVGPQLEGKLNELGVYKFEQIAQWSEENIQWVDEYLAFKGRIERENWVEQAKVLADGGETEFSKRFDA